MHVVATAGHVDHGKSTLVRALTGMEPDRFAEERRRGMTIDLGFVWTPADCPWLPPGERLAFVDVPGHERFVRTMLAGAGPVPAVLLVVAADEGWKPQTEEHVQALDALGVAHGVLALTRTDLAAPARASATEAAVRERLATTSLRDLPVVPVSAVTGAGLDRLTVELGALTQRLPPADAAADVRFWIDRVFTRPGAGTVVTGTLTAGTLRVGDELELAVPGAPVLRVRGLHALGRPVADAAPVSRVAINLRGIGPEELTRGQALVSPGRWLGSTTVDVRLPAATSAPRHVTAHLGSAAVPVTVRPLGDDAARLTLATPLPMRPGDRLLLRDPGDHTVLAARALDVLPPALTRRGSAAARATVLASVPEPTTLSNELERRGVLAVNTARALGLDVTGQPSVAGWLVDPPLWRSLRERLAADVASHAAAQPLSGGLPLDDVRRRLDLPDRRLVHALVDGCPDVVERNGRLLPAARAAGAELPTDVAAAVRAVAAQLGTEPFQAPEANRLRELGLGPRELAAAVRGGLLLKVADGVYLLPGADELALSRLAGLDQPFTTSAARQALGTSRRVAVPLLERLDRAGRTVRVGDAHRRLRGGPS